MLTLERAQELCNLEPTLFYTDVKDDLILFDYRYKDYKFFSDYPEARDMRGIIFSRSGELVSLPFHAFYNVGETPDHIEFTGSYSEKQDGSMAQVTWRNGLVVASRSSLQGYVAKTSPITAELEEYVSRQPGYTFLFELLDPEHTIVLKHEKLELVFLAARNKLTGEYTFPADVPARLNKVHHLSPATWEEIQKQHLVDEGETEGVVLYTPTGIFKSKTPWYTSVHRLVTNLQPKDYILAWAEDKLDDVMGRAYKTEDVQACLAVVEDFKRALKESVIRLSALAASLPTPKDVALAVDRTNLVDALVFPELMVAYRGGYVGEVSKLFAAVKASLTERKAKDYLSHTSQKEPS